MTEIPRLRASEVTKALKRLDFYVVRMRGSHIRLYHQDGRRVTIPRHNRPLFVGTLKSILRQAEISLEELLANL